MACACLLLSASASADVIYSFSGFFSNNNAPTEVDFTGSFTLRTANFINADTVIQAADMLECHAGELSCMDASFYVDAKAAGFSGIDGLQAIVLSDHNEAFYYYFATPAFSGPGTYASQLYFNPATLTVSAVPEPSSVYSMLCGMILLGALAIRRQKNT